MRKGNKGKSKNLRVNVRLEKLQNKETRQKQKVLPRGRRLLSRVLPQTGTGRREIDWKRQTLIFNPEEFDHVNVTIVGLGNIGSQTALALARLGVRGLELYDHDKVEAHNLSSQSFDTSHLGEYKVHASEKQISLINPNSLSISIPKKFTGKGSVPKIVIIAVDTMKGRKQIFKEMKKSKIFPDLLIDGRMGGPQIEVYSCTSFHEWEETFSDNPSNDPCGARYICYSSMVIGSFIANQVKRHLKGETLKREILFNIDNYQLL